MIHIYTDGACLGNPGPGGWAAVIEEEGHKKTLSGRCQGDTTNNRMEILAAINGLQATPEGSEVTVFSDSLYVVNTMTKNWKRRANQDLWAKLDKTVERRRVHWKWVRGHAGQPGNEEADALAGRQIGLPPERLKQTSESPPKSAQTRTENNSKLTKPATSVVPILSHVDAQGQAQMVDVGAKKVTDRVAVARGTVSMKPETLNLIRQGRIQKGEVLAVARVAGINAAKHTWELIPLCHQIPLSQVVVDLELDLDRDAVHITATVRAIARTGAEMEALTAVTVTGLTIYDMCKAVDRGMQLHNIRLVHKSGGSSGDITVEE